MTYHLNLKESDKLASGFDNEPNPNFWYITKDAKNSNGTIALSAQDIADALNTTKWNSSIDDDGYISSDAAALSIVKELSQL